MVLKNKKIKNMWKIEQWLGWLIISRLAFNTIFWNYLVVCCCTISRNKGVSMTSFLLVKSAECSPQMCTNLVPKYYLYLVHSWQFLNSKIETDTTTHLPTDPSHYFCNEVISNNNNYYACVLWETSTSHR